MKKILTIILTIIFNLNILLPCFATDNTQNEVIQQEDTKTFISEVEDEKVFLVPNTVYQLELESDIDANEANKNDEIYFRLVSKVQLSNGEYLPQYTRFAGRFQKLQPSRPVFKRARMYIVIDKIMLPNTQTYTLRMDPVKGGDLKSPQILNIIRALPAGIGVLTFSILSVATVAVESVSIVGLVVVPVTCKGFGLLISSMAKGLNYKLNAGKIIEFRLNSPVYINGSDIK